MSDIIADINKRISEAESARDSALKQVEELKNTIAKNHIVLHNGKAYMFVGSGHYQGFFCSHCPFVAWTSVDSTSCELHRDSCKCADAGGRYYEVGELAKNFKKRMKCEDDMLELQEEVKRLRKALISVSETAALAATEKEGGAK